MATEDDEERSRSSRRRRGPRPTLQSEDSETDAIISMLNDQKAGLLEWQDTMTRPVIVVEGELTPVEEAVGDVKNEAKTVRKQIEKMQTRPGNATQHPSVAPSPGKLEGPFTPTYDKVAGWCSLAERKSKGLSRQSVEILFQEVVRRFNGELRQHAIRVEALVGKVLQFSFHMTPEHLIAVKSASAELDPWTSATGIDVTGLWHTSESPSAMEQCFLLFGKGPRFCTSHYSEPKALVVTSYPEFKVEASSVDGSDVKLVMSAVDSKVLCVDGPHVQLRFNSMLVMRQSFLGLVRLVHPAYLGDHHAHK